MRSIVIELHPGAMRQDNWRTRGRSSAHYWRGDLAVSAGYHEMCQAIVLLGIASRAQVSLLRRFPEGHLEDFYYLSVLADGDMDLPQVVSILGALGHLIEVDQFTGTRRQMLDQVIQRQAAGGICLLDLADPINGCRLWILVVGVEFSVDDGRKSPTALLTLCSSERSVEVAAWNGRLELQSPPDRRWLHYRAVDGSIRKVALGNVVAMKRRLP